MISTPLRTLGLLAVTAPLAWADDPPTALVSGDVGGTARYIDHVDVPDPDAFGMNLGLRGEVNAVGLHLKTDLRYVDGNLFSPSEDRYFDVSFSGSTPALIFLALDVQEVYYRNTSRRGDGIFYGFGGLGFKGKLLGRAKLSVGGGYIAADAPNPIDGRQAPAAYVGLEHMFRSERVDTHIRSTWFVALYDGYAHWGNTTDGDLTVKFPVGKGVSLGPRLDVSYRNLGVADNGDRLFGQRQELTGHLGFAVQWGGG